MHTTGMRKQPHDGRLLGRRKIALREDLFQSKIRIVNKIRRTLSSKSTAPTREFCRRLIN